VSNTRERVKVTRAKRNGATPPPVVPAAEPGKKPKLGLPDPLLAAQEEALHAKEGNHKLGLAVDALRTGLETIAIAEMDLRTKLPVTTAQLRGLAVEALNAYSQVSGQSWRRHKLIGSWAGDRNLATLEDT